MYADHFSINNIPFGIATSSVHPTKSVVTRYHDDVIFLDELAKAGVLSEWPEETLQTFSEPTLNAFAALPKAAHRTVRTLLQTILSSSPSSLPQSCILPISSTTLHLPISVGDFTDFSCSKEHVLNAGEAIQKVRQLPPGFLHFPIGYTGRTSSIIVSGTGIKRPKGQYRGGEGEVLYGPTKAMDYELEVACVVGKPTVVGECVSLESAEEHIFGLVLLNDWSGSWQRPPHHFLEFCRSLKLPRIKADRFGNTTARDIQGLEMPPLGPLNGKSFGTSISPWLITLDALKPSITMAPAREIATAHHFNESDGAQGKPTYDIHLQAEIIVGNQATTLCRSELKSIYWTFRDLIVHQTSNGCNINTGDLLATGTISGTTDESHGCLLELTEGGQKEFSVGGGGRMRTYLEDGDTVRMSGCAGQGVGFGDCIGVITPAT